MKTQLLKKSLYGILMVLVGIFSPLNLTGQAAGEMLQGGGMRVDDESSWTVEIVGRGDFENPVGDQKPNYEFGYSGECANCDGEVLHVWAAGTGYVNIIFSQEVTLNTGTAYKANGAIKDLTGTLNQWWALLKIGIEGNAPSHENEDIKLMGFNTWLDCGQNIDGTWANDACDWEGLNEGEEPDLVGGKGFVLPDELGDEFIAYFAIVVGMYTDGSVAYPYDIIIDEVSLITL